MRVHINNKALHIVFVAFVIFQNRVRLDSIATWMVNIFQPFKAQLMSLICARFSIHSPFPTARIPHII